MKKPEKKSERTRREILEATIECIAQIGVEKTSITAIAERAQVSRGLVAHYFPVKDELFLHVIRYIVDVALEKVEARHRVLVAKGNHSDDPLGDLLDSLHANMDFFLDRPKYFRCLFLFFYFASIDRVYRKMNTEMSNRTIARMSSDLKRVLVARNKAHFDDRAIRDFSESLHRELMGTIEKYYIVEDQGERGPYKAAAMETFRGRVERFLESGKTY